ncbi:Uncharacterised protein [Vibrio cholerae]|nr:Uncharacterised protein [Vibrio cholerae]
MQPFCNHITTMKRRMLAEQHHTTYHLLYLR